MKVKLLVSRAGDRFSQRPGEIVDVPKDMAKRMIREQQAVPVKGETERATQRPTEHAMVVPPLPPGPTIYPNAGQLETADHVG